MNSSRNCQQFFIGCVLAVLDHIFISIFSKIIAVCFFSMNDKDFKYTSNKELLTIPGAVHTDLYDNPDVIPFDKIQKFFKENGVG